MKIENVRSMENLVLFCHLGGSIIMFLGVFVAFMEFLAKGLGYILEGLFIFSTGYVFVKISAKLTNIVRDEKTLL